MGLFMGGLVAGQAFGPDTLFNAKGKTKSDFVKEADAILAEYSENVALSASAAQVTQVANEAQVRYDYIQIKQNAEIIRLLTVIASKK
ncbi:hypothetical protein AUC44_12505 [Deinococcus actinosclerus]|uniref:Uncharacterized protein n=2 Tax=Deinococcus actinosclerus TaxID=1768108 RepID=A0ABM5X779_9DEIO|nr:hypothetical protein AUC44_12505 [Deinococcus actinosclerus]